MKKIVIDWLKSVGIVLKLPCKTNLPNTEIMCIKGKTASLP